MWPFCFQFLTHLLGAFPLLFANWLGHGVIFLPPPPWQHCCPWEVLLRKTREDCITIFLPWKLPNSSWTTRYSFLMTCISVLSWSGSSFFFFLVSPQEVLFVTTNLHTNIKSKFDFVSLVGFPPFENSLNDHIFLEQKKYCTIWAGFDT